MRRFVLLWIAAFAALIFEIQLSNKLQFVVPPPNKISCFSEIDRKQFLVQSINLIVTAIYVFGKAFEQTPNRLRTSPEQSPNKHGSNNVFQHEPSKTVEYL